MRSVELFAGAGGLALGVSQAGFRHEWVVERDKDACETLVHNQEAGVQPLPHWNIIREDVRNLDYSSLRGKIDLVAGGPPCQPFSIGGKHRGPNDERNLWPEAIRAVRDIRPRAFLFENVRGILRPAFRPFLDYVKLQLAMPLLTRRTGEDIARHIRRLRQAINSEQSPTDCSYQVFVHSVNAADYGAAQKRQRVMIVGIRSDQPINWTPPAPTHSETSLLWDQWVSGEYWERHNVSRRHRPRPSESIRAAIAGLIQMGRPSPLPWRTVRDAVGDLERPLQTREVFSNHVLRPGAKSYPGHTGSPLDGPAKALKAGDHGVPGGENTLLLPNGEVRYFTVREAARLQGFPDDYRFPISWTESMRQMGNAVPTQLAKQFAARLFQLCNDARHQ